MSPRVVLVGPPGSGKTAVGELLADRLAVSFRDTDHDVEATAGRTVSDIFVEDGEACFRALEAAAVRTALQEHDGVLALGGGAVLDDGTRALLAGETVVYLEVGLAAAAERVGFARSRPLLVVNPRAELNRLLEERRPLYRAVAGHVVSTDDRTADEVADEIVSLLGEP
jgi:shikimate kinase